MTSGGARARSGPPPDPNALRRERDKADWIRLPTAGRDTPAPAWPLTRATARELALWTREWCRPQALMWEVNGQEIEVAMYVRTLRDAERARASSAIRTLLRQQQETLGLSLPGLARNRWLIVEDTGTHVDRPAAAAAPDSAKERLKRGLLPGGAA